MFDFFKNMGRQKNNNSDQKSDKAFIVIIIVFGVIVAISNIAGMTGKSNMIFDFKLSIFDCIILGGIIIGYLISRLKGKGR